MADLGITELGRDRIIRAAYDAVGIITFFTAGEPEVRGWNLERGASAVEAAGKIHTDLAKGFIRAEVTAFDDLARRRHDQGSQGQAPPAARRQGLHRQGRRHHLLPQRLSEMLGSDAPATRIGRIRQEIVHSAGVRSTAPAFSGEFLWGKRSRLARQSVSSWSDEP